MGGLKYVGSGRWIPGVPARDLAADEAAEHGSERLIGTGLYAAAETVAEPPRGRRQRTEDAAPENDERLAQDAPDAESEEV